MKNCIVIGGGIIGLCSAYYLKKEGHNVTIIDKSNLEGGASYVNAGYIIPSHIIQLAAPGMMAKGIKWMFNSNSPFYIKPRIDLDFIKWLWQFNKSATRANVEKAIPIIKDINIFSKELYIDILSSGDLGVFQLESKGLLMLYKTKKEGFYEKEVAKRVRDLGLEVKELSLADLNKLQPNISEEILGAIHYKCDAHTTPTEFMAKIKDYLSENNVVFKTDEKVLDFKIKNNEITSLLTDKDSYVVDEVILASGSWSQETAKKLQLKISIQAGKGYKIDVNRKTPVVLPAILMEAKVAVTPMKNFTRFAGTMELSGIDHTIRKERIDAIANAASNYYNDLTITEKEKEVAQYGFRPVSPDGLPFIGRTEKFKNLTIATGHSMMGWSLGPATGKLISEVISEKAISMNIDSFQPDRKF